MSLPGANVPAASNCADLIEWQRIIFAARPRRLDLLRLRASWELRPIRIRVHRNQPFEFVASVLAPFLAFAGLAPDILIGPYDDALAGIAAPVEPGPDVEIVWLDFERYLDRHEPEDLAGWLAGRVSALRGTTTAPILVANAAPAASDPARLLNERLVTALAGIAGVHVVDQAALAQELGDRYLDERGRAFAGSAMSDDAAIETARRFGLVWIPAVTAPRLKVLAVDLDGTLYDGVLAEDGSAALNLTDDRAALQRRLVELAGSGLLLAIVSHNEPEDVRRLFGERPDFPLRPEHFSMVVAGWRPKAEELRAIAERLRVATDSILFLDDNPGELVAACLEAPGIKPLDTADAARALRALRLYPGLAALRASREDQLRAADLATQEARSRLAVQSDPQAYLRSLAVKLRFASSPREQQARIHELSNKTNQFNLCFLRLSEAGVAARLADPNSFIVTVALSDRLSDSGVVGLIAGCREPGALPLVDEVAISCRALGRGVEDAIVLEALRGAVGDPPPSGVRFRFRHGPRNQPARDWLEQLAATSVAEGEVEVPWPRIAEALGAVAPLLDLSWETA
jgi:FkbH-like protein